MEHFWWKLRLQIASNNGFPHHTDKLDIWFDLMMEKSHIHKVHHHLQWAEGLINILKSQKISGGRRIFLWENLKGIYYQRVVWSHVLMLLYQTQKCSIKHRPDTCSKYLRLAKLQKKATAKFSGMTPLLMMAMKSLWLSCMRVKVSKIGSVKTERWKIQTQKKSDCDYFYKCQYQLHMCM